ncbi:MAG: OmpH family outer membrane protein [Chitinophagaceae bacterium]
MKKLIVAAVMAFGMLSASAQTKIGYIDTDELIGSMPEVSKIDTELKEYQASLIQQGQDKAKDADDKAAQFVKDSIKMTPSMKEIKRGEIVALYQEVQNWNQIAQDKYNQKAQEKIAPIKAKAFEAINAVAKEKGYSYVIDASTSVLLVKPAGDDLMPFVKAKLGIKETPAKPLTPGKTN